MTALEVVAVEDDTVVCPLCGKDFDTPNDFIQHLRGKPGHLKELLAEVKSLRGELAGLKEAVTAWRTLAQERARFR